MGNENGNEHKSLSDILGPEEHSQLLLGALSTTNASQNFQRSGREIVQNFKNAVEEAIPDLPEIPVEKMTAEQIQDSITKGNARAIAENILDEINRS